VAKRKKKSSFSITKWVMVFNLLAVLFLLVYFYKPIRIYTLRAYRYYIASQTKTKFQKSDFPKGYKVHGIDISHYQPRLKWENLKSISDDGDTIQFRFVFIKATEGTWLEDELFDVHWANAKKNQLVRGAYHYFHPNKDVLQQAKNYFESVKLEAGDLPPVIDIEDAKGVKKKEIVASLKAFIKLLEQRYKVKPIIYSYRNFIEDYLADDFEGYTFWVAHYRQANLDFDDVKWQFWQHTDKASLLMSGMRVDANVFNGSYKDLKKMTLGEIVPSFEQAQPTKTTPSTQNK
jgi:lysozyme